MTSPLELYRQAQSLGLRLETDGCDLLVRPSSKCPPAFADVLRHNKRELLDLLEAKAASLPPDQAAWLPVARQILAGEFEGADRSTVESLTIGLRGIRHPVCDRALEWLRTHSPARL